MLQIFSKSRSLYTLLALKSISVTHVNTLSYERRMQQYFNDGIDIKNQTVEINSIEHIRRSTLIKDVDIWTYYKTLCPNVRTLGDALYEGRTASNDGPCVGFLEPIDGTHRLNWYSYSKVIEQCHIMGSYLWTKTKLTPRQSKVAFLSSNRPEYLFLEYACYMYGFIVVGLHTTYDSATVQDIVKNIKAEVFIVDSLERIKSIENELLNNNHIKQILVMDEIDYDEKSKIRPLSSIFKSMNKTDICQRPTLDPNDIATFMLTSGTTGEPKLAMLSHENLLASTKGNLIRLDAANLKRPVTNRHCSFLPLAHVFERFCVLQVLLKGTEVVFCPAPEKFIEYFSIIKPTQASIVPRIFNKIYDVIMTEVNKSQIKRFLVQQALREQPSFLTRLVFRKVKKIFGGEIKGIITGSAPLKYDIMQFFRLALDVPIIEGYGQTESAAAGSVTHLTDLSAGTIGTPGINVEMKLIDVPDTNYRSENNQGEICIRGPTVFKGYYNDEVKTRETIDEQGWLHTGDVGEWTANGSLKIIDRTKHIFKLSQGKYIAPERLEDVYVRSSWISQIFIDSIPNETTVVAIVIPDEEFVRNNFKLNDIKQKTFADICKDEKLKNIIHSDLQQLAKVEKLHYYEIPSNIYLHSEPFSQKNGLLTVTFKTRRMHVRKQFQSIIQSLYTTSK